MNFPTFRMMKLLSLRWVWNLLSIYCEICSKTVRYGEEIKLFFKKMKVKNGC
jgi:hypothetical protein